MNRIGIGLALAACGALGPAAAGQIVLHSTLSIVNSQTYNRADPDFAGGIATYGVYHEAESVDDFVVAAPATLNSVTLDYLMQTSRLPAQGVVVNLWSDSGGMPGVLLYSAPVGPGLVTGASFNDTVFGTAGLRLTANVTSHNLFLSPGTYWITMKPVETGNSGEAYSSVRDTAFVNGSPTMGRDIVGNLYGSSSWFVLPHPMQGGTTSMEIWGTVVPAPGGLAGLGAAVGVWGARRRRRG